jgi:hypothetical protein
LWRNRVSRVSGFAVAGVDPGVGVRVVGRASGLDGVAAGGVAGVAEAAAGAELDPGEEGGVLLVDDLLVDQRAVGVGAGDPAEDRAALGVAEVDEAAGVEAGHGLAGGLLHEEAEVDAGEVAGVAGLRAVAGEQGGDALAEEVAGGGAAVERGPGGCGGVAVPVAVVVAAVVARSVVVPGSPVLVLVVSA